MTLPCTALNISWLSNTALSTRNIARYCTVPCSYGWSTGTVLYTGSVRTALSTRMIARHFRDIFSLYPADSELTKTLDQDYVKEILFSVQSATAMFKKYNTIISHGFYHSQLCTALLSTGLLGQLGPS